MLMLHRQKSQDAYILRMLRNVISWLQLNVSYN